MESPGVLGLGFFGEKEGESVGVKRGRGGNQSRKNLDENLERNRGVNLGLRKTTMTSR